MDTEDRAEGDLTDFFGIVDQQPDVPTIDEAWESIDPALREGVKLVIAGKVKNAAYHRNKRKIVISPAFEGSGLETIRGVLLHELGHHSFYVSRRKYFSHYTFNNWMAGLWFCLSTLAVYNLLALYAGLPEIWWLSLVVSFGFLLDFLGVRLITRYLDRREEFNADRFAADHGGGYGFARYLLTYTYQHQGLFQKIYGTHPSPQARYDRLMGLDTPITLPVTLYGSPQSSSSFFLGNEN